MKQVKGPPPLWLLPNGHAQRPAEPVRCRESFDGSPAQHDIDPEEHQLQLGLRQLSDPLGEARPVERNELRDVRDRIFRQTSRLRGEGHVAWASAQRGLLVSGTQTTVAMRLRLKASP